MRKLVTWGSLIGLGLLIFPGCGGHEKESDETAYLPEAEVELATCKSEIRTRLVHLPGTIFPSDRAAIASKLMATVAEVPVTIGEKVAEGDLLIRLEAGEVEAQVEQAEASLARLYRNIEREKALLAQSATTAEAVRSLEDDIRLARARLEEARTMQSYMRIRAPFDGVITSKNVKRGDLASPGVPLLNVEGIGNLEVHVEVPDSLNAVPYGKSISISDGNNDYEAIVSEWSPAADPSSRTRLAKLSLPGNSPLRSGQYVRVDWPAGNREVLSIPSSAISSIGQIDRVFVFDGNHVELRIVKTGDVDEEKTEILAGLTSGERIVLNPERTMQDGQSAREAK